LLSPILKCSLIEFKLINRRKTAWYSKNTS